MHQRLTSKSHVRLCSIIRFFAHCIVVLQKPSDTTQQLLISRITLNKCSVLYPRVYLVREQPRGLNGPVPLDSVGRTQQFDMSWESIAV